MALCSCRLINCLIIVPFSNQASQSGLEAAKESLEVVARATKEIKDQTPQLDDGKISIPFWPGAGGGSDSSGAPNLAWVRTAAQAAMALKVHGMLETTGMNSASARLQHASLPSLGSASRATAWEEDDGQLYQNGNPPQRAPVHESLADGDAEGNNFEDGVVTVHSELPVYDPGLGDNGYDLLPLPVPAPERRILSAGNNTCEATFLREGRFHYGTGVDPSEVQVDSDDKGSRAFLGDIAVDENIGKLREVIGSVEHTLARCLASIGGVAKSQSERQSLHVEVVSGLDSWGGMRGKFVSQRSLLKGVSGIELCKELYAEGDTSMIDGKLAEVRGNFLDSVSACLSHTPSLSKICHSRTPWPSPQYQPPKTFDLQFESPGQPPMRRRRPSLQPTRRRMHATR